MSKHLLYSEVVSSSASEDERESRRCFERPGGIVNWRKEYQNVDEEVALKAVLEISKVRSV
jgi:hypothetical protein